MKITDLGSLTTRIVAETPDQRGRPAASGFGDILQKTLKEAESAGAGVAPSGAGVAINLPAAGPISLHSADAPVEGFLDLLGDYQRQLADPRVNLKGLDSVVQAIERGRDALSPLLAVLPESGGLRDVLNQTLVTAELEIIRFRRGDYLPT